MPRATPLRGAFTLIEITLVLAIVGIVAAIGFHQVQRYLDQVATRDAVRMAGALVARARDDAIALHTFVSVRVDTAADALDLTPRGIAPFRAAVGAVHGVGLTSNRDSVAFDPRGLGYGAANFTLVATRGRAADTLVVSRLGRVRY